MADDKEKKYHDLGWPWYHWHFWPFSGFNNMFTQPLLFDDSLTLLQKVAMLWKKLYDLIQDYEQFKKDFATWKAQVESALHDLAQAIEELDGRLDTLEQCCDDMQAWKDVIDAWKSGLEQWREGVNRDITQINQTITEMGDISELRQTVTNQGNTIANHTQRITTLENNYTTLNQNVTNLGNRVTQLGNDLTALSQRVSTNEGDIANIKNALARLDIQLPLELVNDTNFATVSENWYDWIANYCDTHAGNTAGTFKATWTKTDDIQPGITVPHPIPAKQLTIGKVGQNIVLCKMPLIVYAPMTQPTLKSNEAACITEVVNKITSTGMDKLLVDGLKASQDSFFSLPLVEPYPYVIDESKFQTSYMCFCYGADLGTVDISNLYKLSIDTAGNKTVEHATCINMDVRIQLTKDATTGYMQVISNEIYFLIYNGYVAVCFLAENS